uniref:Uncharacterized protein n=1 Tax=Arundo donax TaxID=35708 RepID=A0A0A8XZ41_ARUDO
MAQVTISRTNMICHSLISSKLTSSLSGYSLLCQKL